MKGSFRYVGCCFLHWCFSVALAAILPGSLSAWALPVKGTPAPPLQLTQLLQAPAGARADWPALRGKVVVLEFWATWCGPCVAEVPHLNELASSLDPARFQFIAVDDEAPKIIEGFLAKRRMTGWVGIDTTGRVFARYGVKARPTTIIVDAKGRIVAATYPENVEAADLLAVAAGEGVKFPADADAEAEAFRRAVVGAPGVKPLFEVLLSKVAPNEKYWMTHWQTGMEIDGADAESLLAYAYHVNESRLLVVSPLPDGVYDCRAEFATADDSVSDPILQADVAAGLHLRVQRKTITRSVYVLKATDATRKLLTPTASTGGSMWGVQFGTLKIVNGSMGDLAFALEDALETPVVNETGIEGKFDVDLLFFRDRDLQKDALLASDMRAAKAVLLRQKSLLLRNDFKAVLLRQLGLELHLEVRPTEMLEVSQLEQSKPPVAPALQPVLRPTSRYSRLNGVKTYDYKEKVCADFRSGCSLQLAILRKRSTSKRPGRLCCAKYRRYWPVAYGNLPDRPVALWNGAYCPDDNAGSY